MEKEVTDRHGLLQVYFNSILINVATNISPDAAAVGVKGDNSLEVIGISHEESI